MTMVDDITTFQSAGKTITVERQATASGDLTLWVTGEDQRPRAYHSRVDPRHEARRQLDAFYNAAEENVLWVYLGAGLGYVIEELDRTPPAGLVCVECDEHLVNGSRSRELPETITSLVGLSSAEVLIELEKIRQERGCKDVRMVTNPAALSSFPSYYQPILQGLQPAKTQPRTTRFFIKEQPSERCYIIVDTGYFLVRELAAALERQGQLVMILRMPLSATTALPDPSRYADFLRKLVEAVEHLQPEALVTVNHLGFDREGILTELLARLKLPALVWYVDSPRYIFQNPEANTSDWVGVFVWDRSYLSWLRDQGFTHVHYLPLGTDPQIFNAAAAHERDLRRTRAEQDDSLLFVGDSMAASVQKALKKLPLDLQRDLSQNPNSQVARLAQDYWTRVGAPDRPSRSLPWIQFQRALKATGIDPTSPTTPGSGTELNLADLESALTLMATRQRRLDFIRDLYSQYHDLSLTIMGDSDWREILNPHVAPHPARLTLKPPADYYRELPWFYREAGAVLNLTSLQMPHGLNQRCYDVPAAGGFLITDNQPALAEQFDLDREVVTFTQLAEFSEKWKYYCQHARQRQEIINHGLRRVLQEHTYRHRLREMLKVARSWFD